MKTGLITGVAGYLGSHVAKTLKLDGWKVVGLDQQHTHNKYVDYFYPYNVLDYSQMMPVFTRHRFDVVFHFAGLIDVAESIQLPIPYYLVNCVGTNNILSLMSLQESNNIIYSSTAGVYKSQIKKLSEKDEVNPLNNPYAGSKYCAELAITQSGLNHVIFRYFNLAGADPEGEFGENHEPETHLIPRILQNLNTFTIYGSDYDTQDGTCVRDFVHVSDVANAHLAAANYLLAGNKSITLNLGTGKGHSVKRIVELVEVLLGKKIETRIVDRRPGDPAYLASDISLAKNVLKFEPKYDILDILQTAHKWHKKS